MPQKHSSLPTTRRAVIAGGASAAAALALPSFARAQAASPRLLLADEPPGQLSAETGLSVMRSLGGIVDSGVVTAVVATHDAVMMSLADRVLTMADGRVDGGDVS